MRKTRASDACPCASHYSVVRFMERPMILRRRLLLSVLGLYLCGTAIAQTSQQVNGAVPLKKIRVTLLGTASGPRVHVGVAGISTLVEARGERFLFDAGRGFMQRLVQAGFPMNAVTKLFLTHLHSDHVVDVPDLVKNRRWMKQFKERWKTRLEQLELWMISYRIDVE